MDSEKPVAVSVPPAEVDAPPGYPPPWDKIVVGRVWIRVRARGRRILGRLRGEAARERERVVVLRYSKARVTRALSAKMFRENREWTGWRVGYKVLPPGSRSRSERTRLGLRTPMRWRTEEEFRELYQRVRGGEGERKARLAALGREWPEEGRGGWKRAGEEV